MHVSVIVCTYNEPEWLEKVLWGYQIQTHRDFEIIIADDGSASPTREVVSRFQRTSGLRIHHVWHPDLGYRKCQILNKAVQASGSPYLIFTDGDCIPHPDFVLRHVQNAEDGYFLSGGAIRLPMDTSKAITQSDIERGNAFDIHWLMQQGLPDRPLKNLKLVCHERGFDGFLNAITPAKATWNGGNSSTWKKYIVQSNGFDERMQYGGQDREFGERLINLGVRGKQLRYSAICVHLEHGRGYKNDSAIQNNQLIRRETRLQKRTWTDTGMLKFL
jgi:glycosyltransferase involved in cell wall biosynthesis